MSRLHPREALKLTAAGVAMATLAPAAFAASRPKVPGPRTEVRRHRGLPRFFLDGEPYTKPVFETYVPETKFLRQFAEAGTDVFCFSTNLGPGFGKATGLGPDQWDFEALDALARRVLDANPRGLRLPRIYLTPPDWWVQANPDECQVLSHGGKHYRHGIGHGRDGKAFPSLASHQWRADSGAALERVIRHMQESDYGAHLFGYMVTGLMSEEWYHWSIHSGELSDYRPNAVREYPLAGLLPEHRKPGEGLVIALEARDRRRLHSTALTLEIDQLTLAVKSLRGREWETNLRPLVFWQLDHLEGAEREETLTSLVADLHDVPRDDQTRWRSLGLLDWLAEHPQHPEANQALTRAVETRRADIRKAAAVLAGRMARWALLETLSHEDPDRSVRERAKKLLTQRGRPGRS